jgi:hypothetical protein
MEKGNSFRRILKQVVGIVWGEGPKPELELYQPLYGGDESLANASSRCNDAPAPRFPPIP